MADETFEFEQEVFTLTDEDGNESDFELIGTMEIDSVKYVALLPVEGTEDEYVILKLVIDEDGDEILVTIDDDDEFDKVADAFEDEFMGDIDHDALDTPEE
ncbi:MAG: DUF1292 domain-containing protein [Clostridia bacterium]|nr:DUF1292 domain-containing protein [Clostridia bacterium]